MKTIYIDLDGTILDISERIYRVYKHILQKHNKKFLLKNDYLKLKRKRIPIEEILKKTGSEDIFRQFKREWEKEIESHYYLDLDSLSYSKRNTLLYLKNHYRLVLVTLRKYPRRLFTQLKRKKIDKIFNKTLVISTEPHRLKWKFKYRGIKKYGDYDEGSIIIGDTETDILAGKKLGIKTVAVLNGMRNRKFLKKYKPDILINDFSKIKNIINYEI